MDPDHIIHYTNEYFLQLYWYLAFNFQEIFVWNLSHECSDMHLKQTIVTIIIIKKQRVIGGGVGMTICCWTEKLGYL